MDAEPMENASYQHVYQIHNLVLVASKMNDNWHIRGIDSRYMFQLLLLLKPVVFLQHLQTLDLLDFAPFGLKGYMPKKPIIRK